MATAQPVIPPGNNNLLPGDMATFHAANSYESMPAGVQDAWWDLSKFISIQSTSMNMVAPPADATEGTTVSEMGGSDVYLHYNTSADAYELIGLRAPMLNYDCSDGQIIIPYPISFGSELTDAFNCAGVFNGNDYTRVGSVEHLGASWGTLVLPYGSFENVMMLQSTLNFIETVEGDENSYEYQSVVQQFLRPGLRPPLFFGVASSVLPGQWNYSSFMLDVNSVGLEEAMNNAIGMDLMPNPATDRMEVVYSATGSTMLFEIFDTMGRVVRTITPAGTAVGALREVIDVSGLAAGTYNLRITDRKGAAGVKRFVVQ